MEFCFSTPLRNSQSSPELSGPAHSPEGPQGPGSGSRPWHPSGSPQPGAEGSAGKGSPDLCGGCACWTEQGRVHPPQQTARALHWGLSFPMFFSWRLFPPMPSMSRRSLYPTGSNAPSSSLVIVSVNDVPTTGNTKEGAVQFVK